MKTHECYLVRDKSGQVVYIGEGIKGRHKHVNSGISHVYHLNSGHFEGVRWDVEVFELDSKVESQFFEKALIDLHNPRFNTMSTDMLHLKSKLSHVLREIEERYNSYDGFKAWSVYGVLKCAMNNKITNDYEVTFRPMDLEEYLPMFGTTTHTGNVIRSMKRDFAKGRDVALLFFDSMVSNESTTSYTVKLNKDIANMKRYTLVDYLIRKGGVKKPDKELQEK